MLVILPWDSGYFRKLTHHGISDAVFELPPDLLITSESPKRLPPSEPFEVRFKDAKYGVILVMGGDGDLGPMLDGDFYEMSTVVNEDVAVLALVDYPAPEEGEEDKGSRGLGKDDLWDIKLAND